MSTPLPVPSKVAVTAIRGLIVGTTCSLALITEDRRRRIKSAHNAIQNADRIKSAKNYHRRGPSIALALDEDAALFDRTTVPRSPSVEGLPVGDARSKSRDTRSPPMISNQPEGEELKEDAAPVRTNATQGHGGHDTPPLLDRPRPPIRPHPHWRLESVPEATEQALKPSILSASSRLAFPKPHEIAAMVEEAVLLKDPQKLDRSIHIVSQALAVGGVYLEQTMMAASALLCRTCHETGRPGSAREILTGVLKAHGGLLQEEYYYSFEPLKLLDEHILPDLERKAREHRLERSELRIAVDLYLPTFTGDALVKSEQGFIVGRRLLDLAFATHWLTPAERLYKRCLHHREADFEFIEWFISQLHATAADIGGHKRVVNCFLLDFTKPSPSYESVERISRYVTQSVVMAHGYKADAVLKSLDQLCSGRGKLHTTWLLNLLAAHFNRKRNFDEIAALLAPFQARGIRNVVSHPRAVWMAVLGLASRAERPEMVERYFSQACLEDPGFASEPETVLILAKHKARAGDWRGVEHHLQQVRFTQPKHQKERFSRSFRGLAALFAESHTVAETDAFLRRYITELDIPASIEMVTLMAKQYASVRDAKSLVAWLEFCAGTGMIVDSGFTSAVLTSCRRWNLPHRDLRTLYLKLRALGGSFTDDATELIMVDAALEQAASGREPVGRLMRSSRIRTPRRVINAGRCRSPQEIILAMKEDLITRKFGRALSVYRKSLQNGAFRQLPDEAVRLAIQASLQSTRDVNDAYRILRKAEQLGADTSSCVVPIVTEKLKQIGIPSGQGDEARYPVIRKILGELAENGIRVSDVVLNQAAFACLKARDYHRAIDLGLMAAEAHKSGGRPFYNKYNFAVLLAAFAHDWNVPMLRLAISGGKSSLYWTDTLCLKVLKSVRKLFRSETCQAWRKISEAQDIIQRAIEHCVAAREKLRGERLELQSDVLEIMLRAAETQKKETPQGQAEDDKVKLPNQPLPGMERILDQPILEKEKSLKLRGKHLNGTGPLSSRKERLKDPHDRSRRKVVIDAKVKLPEPVTGIPGPDLFDEALFSRPHVAFA